MHFHNQQEDVGHSQMTDDVAVNLNYAISPKNQLTFFALLLDCKPLFCAEKHAVKVR